MIKSLLYYFLMSACFLLTSFFACAQSFAQSGHKDVLSSIQSMSREFALLKQYDAQGSPLRSAQEDWASAAKLARTDPNWRNWVIAREDALKDWMTQPRDRYDMVVGYGFKLLDTKGIPVKWSPKMAEPDRHGLGGEEYWRAWVSWTRSHNISRIQEAARLYRLTGNTLYRDWAITQLDFYADNYMNWPLQVWNGKARMMSQSLDEATGLVYLIDAVRLFAPELQKQKLNIWRTKLFYPIVQNLLDFNQGVNNIAVWHSCAIAMVAIEFDDAKLLDQALNGKNGLNALLKKGVTSNYLWYEGAFSYNNYVIAALTPLFVQASLKDKGGLFKRQMLLAQNMLLSPLQFRFDDGYLPTVGDTRGRGRAIDFGAYLSSARVLPTEIGIQEAQRVKSWDTLIDSIDNTTKKSTSLPTVTTKHYEPSRAAVLKNTNWQVFVHYGQLTQAHAQAEVPGYELYWRSIPVAVDQGTVDYGSPWHEQYFRRAVAHNLPLIDGEGQESSPLFGHVDSFDLLQPAISISEPLYQKGVMVSRQISLQDNFFVDSTRVTLKDVSVKRRLGMVFNTDCKLDLSGSNLGVFNHANAPLGTGFSYWSDIKMGAAPAQWNAKIVCNNQSFNIQFSANQPHKVYRSSVPATPLPKRREAVYLEFIGSAANFEVKINPL